MKKILMLNFLGILALVIFTGELALAARASNGLSCASKGDDEGQGIDEIRLQKRPDGSYSFTFHPTGGKAQTISGLTCIFVDSKDISTPQGERLEFTDTDGQPLAVTLPLMRCQLGDLVIRGTIVPMIYAIPFDEQIRPAGPRYEIIIKNNPFSTVKKPIYRFGTAQSDPSFDCREL